MTHAAGWIKLHRSIINKQDISGNALILGIFVRLLIEAEWRDDVKTINWNGKPRKLKRGQCLIKVRQWADSMEEVSRSGVMRSLKYLAARTTIALETGPRGTIVTILNYSKYQDIRDDAEPQMNHDRTTVEPRSNHDRTTVEPQLNHNSTTHLEFPNDSSRIPSPKKGRREEGKKERREESKNTLPGGSGPPKRRTKPPTDGSQVWEAYKCSYFDRYGTEPVRNAQSNALCSQLVKRLGKDEAIAVVSFYLNHTDRWYIQNLHALRFAVRDAEKLHTEWKLGAQMTSNKANNIERKTNIQQAIDELIEENGNE